MPYLDRQGVKIYYEDHGRGPTVLLSHGYSATSQMWAGQIEALAGRYRVITWDMRGHGQSDSPTEPDAYSEALTVADMAGILRTCGVERAVIGGLSLGGYMSLAFNLTYPNVVSALMLFDTGPGFKSPHARDAWNEKAKTRATALESEGLDAITTMGSREMKASVHRSAAGLAAAARGMLTQFDSRVIESLPGIQVPTLILVGANDQPFLAPAEYMASKIPNSKRVVIRGAGHAANLDQPGAFNEAVLSFLSMHAQT